MRTAALIAAAGVADGVGPMDSLGSISVAQRIVASLRQAGVERIVVITGSAADELEHHLSGSGVIFLRNENFETTEMFDSAKIGLGYLRDKCERVLFMPADIPLFTAATVKTLLSSNERLAIPVFHGRAGHPLLLASELIDTILSDSGECGLEGALSRCGQTMEYVEVADEGILLEADEGSEELLREHNRQLVRQIVSVSLARERVFFDARTAMFLRLVDETGSVRRACERMQLSYTGGWNIIRTLESQVSGTLIESVQGGRSGGRSSLTDRGRELLRRFDAFEEELKEGVAALYEKYFEGIL